MSLWATAKRAADLQVNKEVKSEQAGREGGR